jgi:hypothetical protein
MHLFIEFFNIPEDISVSYRQNSGCTYEKQATNYVKKNSWLNDNWALTPKK